MVNPPGKKRWHVVVLAFVFFGILIECWRHPMRLLLPALIVGIVYYLYKSPPRWLLRLGSYNPSMGNKRQAKSKPNRRKKYPFRVIDGNNKKKSL